MYSSGNYAGQHPASRDDDEKYAKKGKQPTEAAVKWFKARPLWQKLAMGAAVLVLVSGARAARAGSNSAKPSMGTPACRSGVRRVARRVRPPETSAV